MLSHKQFKRIYKFFIVDKNGVTYLKSEDGEIIVWIPFDADRRICQGNAITFDFLEMVALKHGCIVMDIVPLLDDLGINADDIFE
jgi:hypothetical protein